MRIHLVRHGETEGQSSIRYHGANDVALSDIGRAQIRALAPHLREAHPQVVWHSPQIRAEESARILCDELGLGDVPRRVQPDFREISFGRFEGFTAQEIQAADPVFHAAWQAGEVDGFPEGEPRRAFAERVAAAWREVLDRETAERILVVAHRGTVRIGLRWLLGVPERDPDDFAVDLASVSTVRRTEAGFELERLGVSGGA